MRKLSLLALAALLPACGEAPPPEEPSDQPVTQTAAATTATPHIQLPAMLQEGQTVYQTVCWTCHGTAGRGDGPATAAGAVDPPPSFHLEEYASASGQELEERFQTALDTVDPAHPHMQYVASFIRPDRFGSALAYVPALAYPPELPGSALAGQELYAFRCAGCHGETGQGDGPGAEALSVAPPADFTQDTLLMAQDWDAVFARVRDGGQVVHGSSMPPWGIVLTDGEIWDLVAYLGTFQEGLLSTPPWQR